MEDKEKLQMMFQAAVQNHLLPAQRASLSAASCSRVPEVLEDFRSQLRRSSAAEMELQSVLDSKAARLPLIWFLEQHARALWPCHALYKTDVKKSTGMLD